MLPLPRVLAYFATELPAWAARIVGADAATIAALERALERPLLPGHRELLLAIGGDPAGLFHEFVGLDVRAQALLDHLARGGWRPERPLHLLGVDPNGLPTATFLREREAGLEPEVLTFGLPGRGPSMDGTSPARPDPLAPDLATLVFRCGFDNLIGGQYPTRLMARVLQPDEQSDLRLDLRLRELGLRVEPGLDRYTGSYRAQEAAIQWIRNSWPGPLWLRGWGMSERLLRELVDGLIGATAVQIDLIY